MLPCSASDLIAPCWVEARPIVVSAFTEIWVRTVECCEAIAQATLVDITARNPLFG